MKILVPDTNLLLHGKFITEINWSSVFNNEEIKIFLSYMVLKELDKTKYSNNTNRKKRARQLISFLKKYDRDKELQNRIPLIISYKNFHWKTIPNSYKKLLDKEEADHRILAEIILKFSNYLDDVYLITADYTLLKFASELGIKGIDWLEQENYKDIFNIKKKIEPDRKHPDLEISFDAELIKKELTLRKENNKQKLLNYDDLIKPNVQYDTKWELEHPGVIDDLIESYNEQIVLINKHQEITFFLINQCDHPYNDVDIYITTTLEKDFILTVKKLIKRPPKPFIPEMKTIYARSIPVQPQDGIYYNGSEKITALHSLDMSIEYEEKEKDTNWEIFYHLGRIKHNTFVELHPLLIYIPNSYETNVIRFNIAYTHEEPGKIKGQKRIIHLL